ncbi:MAG: PQQ-dependent sugar dehydrogenase [Pseudomonadota bacterium]
MDYIAAAGQVTIVAGDTSASAQVTVRADTEAESDETFRLQLSNAVNATLARAAATATILDDDSGSDEFGLDVRPTNSSCVAPARPVLGGGVDMVEAYPGLPDIPQPVKILLEPVASPRWFVLQKTGQIVTFDPSSASSTSLYFDLNPGRELRTNSEGGLLGMAFHPDYPATPEIFLYYTIDHTGPDMRSVLSRFILDDVVSPGAGTVEEVLLQADQDRDNHNAGDIAFGPDGYLYVGLGDGGGFADVFDRAQDTTRLVGSMLRIDVDSPDQPYGIPSDNPFAANPLCGPAGNASACPEIYAWGFRNPWRWSFDGPTGQLWLADVGQRRREEINLVELGGNYGWRCREGTGTFDPSNCGPAELYVEPVSDYPHSQGSSITGGFVYRGSAIPSLVGRYVFADYISGRVWALEDDGEGNYLNEELLDTNFGLVSFGIGPDGELYATDINSSRIRKLVPSGSAPADSIPDLLTDTGCVDPTDPTQLASGLIPYDLNATFWSDGALKDRAIALPDGEQVVRGADGDWTFPNGTVLVKNFRLDGRLIETRHLIRHPDGVWAGYTYEWNVEQTEATRVVGGKTVSIAGQDWIYPSGAQCMQCHTSAAGFALGAEDAQLNKPFTYPSTGRTANQLETLDHIMVFASPLEGDAATLPRMADPENASAPLDERARAYLHTNCSQCHRPGAPSQSTMDLRYATPLAATNACGVAPILGDLGVPNARLIAPGDASRSIVIDRANRRDVHGMPPVGSSLIDADGVSLLTAWIQLASCD